MNRQNSNVMQKVTFLILLIGLTGSAKAQINLNKLKKALEGESVSTEEVAQGLKEALTNGVSKGSDLVSQIDGYFKNPEINLKTIEPSLAKSS